MKYTGRAKSIVRAANAKYLTPSIHKNTLSKAVSRLNGVAYGSTGLLNDHLAQRGKSFTPNIGQKLLSRPRKLPRSNVAKDTTAKSLANAAGFGTSLGKKSRGSRGQSSQKHLSKWTANPDKLNSFADKTRMLALTGMSG